MTHAEPSVLQLQLLSDLHLERHPHWQAQAAPGAQVLVLAGDIGSYQAGSRLADERFGLDRFSPKLGAPWPQVVFVPGNHEYDGLDHAATRHRLKALCDELGIICLDQATWVHQGVRFVGCTLWSDFDAYAEPAHTGVTLQRREKAFKAANFYLRKNSTVLNGAHALAPELRTLALADQAWLSATLAVPHAGPTVVVTHFAPSTRSADPRYGHTPGTAGFCNHLEHLMPGVSLWLHGHLHAPSDYTVATAQGHCRVMANPRGYEQKNEHLAFRANDVIPVHH